jgi:hypothetical protein
MLRTLLLVLSGIAFLCFVGANLLSDDSAWPPAIATGVIFLGMLMENFRYKRLRRDAPGEGWQNTGERFVDPESGATVTVYFNPDSGERSYVSRDK